MVDKKLIPDMSTPEGIKDALEHIKDHASEADPAELQRIVELELLRVLREAEVEDASVIEEELTNYPDASTIGDIYTEDQEAAPDANQHIELKRVAGVAHAVGVISAAALIGASDNDAAAKAALEEGEINLHGIGDSEEAIAAKETLGGIIKGMASALSTPEE